MSPPTAPHLSWRARSPVYYGWLVLGTAFLAAFGATGMTQVAMGGIQIFITEDTGWSRTTVSLAVTGGSWLGGVFSPFLGRLVDKYGPRWLMAFGLVVAALAYFSLGEAREVWQFYIAYMLGRAVSNPSLIGVVPQTAVVNFFRRRRNVTLGIMSAYRPIGAAITIQIISLISVYQSWRAAFQYLALFNVFLVLPLIFIMRRQPEDIGLLPDGARPGESFNRGRELPGTRPAIESEAEFSWTTREAIGSRSFWLIGASTVFGAWATSATGFSLVPYLHEEVGLSKTQAVGVLSFGTFLSVSNLAWGYLADRITPRRCLLICLVMCSGMVVFLIWVNSLTLALVFAVVWGVFSGSIGSLEHMVMAQYFGRRSYGSITGLVQPLSTFALGMGPAVAAIMVGATGSSRGLYLVVLAVHLVSVLCVVLASIPANPPRRPAEAAQPV